MRAIVLVAKSKLLVPEGGWELEVHTLRIERGHGYYISTKYGVISPPELGYYISTKMVRKITA